MAAEVARRFEAELVLLSAYKHADGKAPGHGGNAELEWATSSSSRQREVVARTRERLRQEGVGCRVLAEEGDPADVLVRLAKQCGADILVVGNKGIQRRVLGSVPNR